MSIFFKSTTNSWDEQVFVPTVWGFLLLALMVIGLLVLMLLLLKKTQKKISAKQLTFCGASIAIAMVLSLIKAYELPFGGAITFFSMLFICLVGYVFGPRIGITAGVAYGLLQFILDPVFYTIPQAFVDYILAFGALGFSGFFYKNSKYGLLLGYLAGGFGRLFFAFLSGILFFGAYAPEGTPVAWYSITYNAGYILPEMLMTVIILCVPQVSRALRQVKGDAVS